MPRHPSPRRVKRHYSYTVKQLARQLQRTEATIRSWIADGLCPIDRQRPLLVNGNEVHRYLGTKLNKGRHVCGVGRLFCVACREPQEPAYGLIEYIQITPVSGNLRGICPLCANLMHRRVAFDKIDQVRGKLQVEFAQGQPRMGGTLDPSDNPNFKPRS